MHHFAIFQFYMSIKEMAFKIEKLQNDALKIDSISTALWQAISNGAFDAKTYDWAFVVLTDLTYDLKENLITLTEDTFMYMRNSDIE